MLVGYIDLQSENEMNYQVDDLLKVDSKRDINGHRLVQNWPKYATWFDISSVSGHLCEQYLFCVL